MNRSLTRPIAIAAFAVVTLVACSASSESRSSSTTSASTSSTTAARPDPTPELNEISSIIDSVLPLVERSASGDPSEFSGSLEECTKATVEIGNVGARMFQQKLNGYYPESDLKPPRDTLVELASKGGPKCPGSPTEADLLRSRRDRLVRQVKALYEGHPNS